MLKKTVLTGYEEQLMQNVYQYIRDYEQVNFEMIQYIFLDVKGGILLKVLKRLTEKRKIGKNENKMYFSKLKKKD